MLFHRHNPQAKNADWILRIPLIPWEIRNFQRQHYNVSCTVVVEVTSYEPIYFGSVFPPCRLYSARQSQYLFPLSRNGSLQGCDSQTFFKL